jgi:5-amino-6-(5-phospho-D-ribitylamino)uracil phosphatase
VHGRGMLIQVAMKPTPIQKARIKLVAVDLDGTLLDSSKRVCPKAAKTLLGLARRGVLVVIASARPPRSVRQIYQSLGLATWQINYNGAMIWDEPGRQVVEHVPMDCRLARQIIDEARARFQEVLVSCEILDRWYTDRAEQSFTTETGRLFQPDVVAPLDEICIQPITKLMLLGEPAMMLELEARLAVRGQAGGSINLVRSDPDLIQIMHHQASKAAALRTVAGHYRVAMEQVMAIGDAANDISMLQAAGVAVAMDNSSAAVKAAADWIAPSNDERGVYEALVRYGLT